MDLIRALFQKKYDSAEQGLRSLADTTFEGKTVVKSDVLFASEEFKKAEALLGEYQESTPEAVSAKNCKF